MLSLRYHWVITKLSLSDQYFSYHLSPSGKAFFDPPTHWDKILFTSPANILMCLDLAITCSCTHMIATKLWHIVTYILEYTVGQLIFRDITFEDCQKFAIHRIFCQHVFDDDQVVCSRCRWSYIFVDKYFRSSVKILKTFKVSHPTV